MVADLRQLQALVAIARHGTLARAADELHCSPSALSMQLSSVQARLGVTLLRRTGRGLALTPEGELLLPAAREAVEAVRRLGTLAAGQAGPGGGAGPAAAAVPVLLGTILDPAALRLGEFLQAVRLHGPPVHPELRHGVSGWVLQELVRGRLDVGFCLGRADAVRLRVQRLAPVRYVVVAPRGWQGRLQGRGWADLAALPWIGTPRESVHHQLLQPLFQRLKVRMNTVARVDQEASMIDLVRAGFGLSLAREAVALREQDQSGLVVSRLHALDTELLLVARRLPDGDALGPTLQAWFDVAARIWAPGVA